MLEENNPLISVIIPVYKVEQYLRKCVDSVINQTYKNLEIILVDDGSPDNCGKICDEYAVNDARVRTIHCENTGQSGARNIGLSIMKGEYITFIDSDDYVADDYIEFLYDLLKKNNADISQCGHYVVYSENRSVDKNIDHSLVVFNAVQAIESICYNGIYDITICNKLFKRDIFSGIRFPVGKIYEDTAVSYIVAERAKKIVCQMIPKYHYIQRYDSTANGVVFSERKYQFIGVGDELADYVSEHYPHLADAANVKRVFVRLSTLSQMVNSNHYDKQKICEMTAVIKKYRRSVLFNSKASKRDKLGIVAISLGYSFYRVVWKTYYKIVRKK